MLAVADSSPLIVLVNLKLIDLLPQLFGKVTIPPQVLAELQNAKRPKAIRDFLAAGPGWLVEKAPAVVESIPLLHAGEMAAISLAQELKADLLLIDEVAGRKAAADRQILFTGTVGVLELAADRGLVDLAEAFGRIKQTDFWISHALLEERLKLHQTSQRKI